MKSRRAFRQIARALPSRLIVVERNDPRLGYYGTSAFFVQPDTLVCWHSTESAAINRARIASIVAFIHKNAHRPFGVEDLLGMASMPRSAFVRHFESTVGITPASFIDRCRVERATSLLAATQQHSLTEIASLSGFSSARRFRQVFRRLVGLPPSVYLRQQKEASCSPGRKRISEPSPRRKMIAGLTPR
jgi:transcriptional regulator GlxA family with amidase domain